LKADKLIEHITDFGLYASMVTIIVMMLMVTTETIIRTFFGVSMMVVDEFAGYMLVWFVFWGIGYCLRTGSLLRVAIVYSRLGDSQQRILQVIFDIFSLAVSVILCYQLVHLWIHTWQTKVISVTQVEIPVWIPQTVMPIGMLILIAALLVELRRHVKDLIKPSHGDAARGNMSRIEEAKD
jgi:TRAP-type C4-dicarboxylate transport system permease small subunit